MIKAFLIVSVLTLFVSCGGGSTPKLTVNVLDNNGDAVEDAFVQVGTATLTGTTDSTGKVVFENDELKDPQPVTVGKSGYRNYTVLDVDLPEIHITLTELEPPHGYVRASIEDASWAPLADNCPVPGVAPCDVRFGLIWIATNDITNVYDITDCESCLTGGLGVIPFFGQLDIILPAGLDQARIFSTAGLLDTNTFTFTFSRYGITEFAVDATNTAANPKDVEIPLAYDMTDASAVTIDVTAAMPTGLDTLTELIAIDLADYGFGLLEGFLGGMNIGGEMLSATSYRFRGLNSDNIAPEPLLSSAGYVVAAGFSTDDDTAESWQISKPSITDTAQTVTVDTLLDLPQGLTPANYSVISPDNAQLSWSAVANATVYVAEILRPFFNGTTLEDRMIWQFIAPSDVTSITLPTLEETGLPILEACQFYHFKASAIIPAGFEYSDGIYPGLQDLFFEFVPSLHSTNTTTFFTEGVNCGPLISLIDPADGLVGDTVTLSGMYFGSTQGTSTVSFGGTAATEITTWSDTSIAAKVPTHAAGAVELIATVNGVASNTAYFEIREP